MLKVRKNNQRAVVGVGGLVGAFAAMAIQSISAPPINNIMYIRVGDMKMSDDIGIFRNGSIKRWLTRNGWTINADLTPTAVPAFGQGFGRTEPLRAKKTHPLVRVFYILPAIAIFCAIAWARMQTNR